eukprot:c19218_g1_i2 orf=689-976(+)
MQESIQDQSLGNRRQLFLHVHVKKKPGGCSGSKAAQDLSRPYAHPNVENAHPALLLEFLYNPERPGLLSITQRLGDANVEATFTCLRISESVDWI